MITQKDFIFYIDQIEKYRIKQLRFANFINDELCYESTSSAFSFGNDLVEAKQKLLASHFKNADRAFDDINYYTYENPEDKAVYINYGTKYEKRYPLTTPEELYEYLVK